LFFDATVGVKCSYDEVLQFTKSAAVAATESSLVIKDLAYEAMAKAKSFFSRPRPRT